MIDAKDQRHMRAALTLARRGLGMVWPNPSVGCIVTDVNGAVVGRGWTQPGGRPHAETVALDRAGMRAKGGTAYVTLEPCNHYGKTPPCTEALIAAGVSRLVATCEDPDERVSGNGFARLREAGVEVELGLMQAEAIEMNAGFFQRISSNRPRILLKLATSRDGKIALASGESQWITGPQARMQGHVLRAECDGIMVGIGTVLADDPSLTCRLAGYAGRVKTRVVLDTNARLPKGAKMRPQPGEGTGNDPVLVQIVGSEHVEKAIENTGGEPFTRVLGVSVDAGTGRVDVAAALALLAELGLTRLLVEGGGTVAAALLRADLIDEIHHFQAPMMIGAEGRPCIAELAPERLNELPRFETGCCEKIGEDIYTVLTANRALPGGVV